MVYQQTEKYTCGPSSYIGAFNLPYKKEEEIRLHEIGRIKPSRIFLGLSFLQINPNLYLYIEHTKITAGLIKIVFNPKVDNFTELLTNYYKELVKNHKKHIKMIKKGINSILTILNEAIKLNKKAVLLTHSSHWIEQGHLHWIFLAGQNEEGDFLFGDPLTGKILKFSETDIKKQLVKVAQADFPLQIVTDFEAYAK